MTSGDPGTAPRVAVLPYDVDARSDLGSVRLQRLLWPFQDAPSQGTVSDLAREDHLLVYPNTSRLWRPRRDVRCRISLMLAEPIDIHRSYYFTVPLVFWRFFRVLSHDYRMVRMLPNGIFHPAAETWISDPEAVARGKSRLVSLIASQKTFLEGHRHRHDLARWARTAYPNLDLLGRGYRPLADKQEGLAPYMFSVVIENSRHAGYFTEKLIDALVCGTVPIYWGAPDIGRYFDLRGLVICETLDELKAAVNTCSEQQFRAMQVFIEENRRRAQEYPSYPGKAAELISAEDPAFAAPKPVSRLRGREF